MRIRTALLLALPLSTFLTCAATTRTGSAQEAAHLAPEARLELNKSVARRVYDEGLSQGIFEVPYTDDFVGHGGASTFTHAQGLAEATGWRSAFRPRSKSWKPRARRPRYGSLFRKSNYFGKIQRKT